MNCLRPKPLLASLCLALVGVPTTTAADPPEADGLAYFENHVRPLLAKHCYSCHSTRSKKSEGGLRLDSRAGWIKGGDNGPAVIPGDAEASLLIKAVRYTDPKLQMPPDHSLPQKAIAHLEEWVRRGAPDPRDDAPGSSSGELNSGGPSDPVSGRQHWAFRPLTNPRPPVVQAPDWPETVIDRFVLAPLEAARLRPAPDANRRTLARRLSLLLIGLPPAPEDVAEFLSDNRPDAYERLVDRLLSSPHFGERWGRHWLDLARYADSNGLDENFLFREAWRYRNWVIDTVNADVRFDQFVTSQIAGDLLPYESLEQRDRQRLGAGFLVIGPKVLLGVHPKLQRMDIADEQVDTIGKAILGQTLGCARCHDHKFDPIPTADYYALAGILTSTKVMEERHMLGQQRVMERLVGLGPNGEELDAAYEKYWRDAAALKAREKHARTALELLEKGDSKALEELIAKHADALASGATDATEPIDKRIAAQKAFLAEWTVEAAAAPPIPARAMVPADSETPADEHVRIAGQFDRLGTQVPRGFLRVLDEGAIEIPTGRSGRLEFSHWLTDIEGGAGRLSARVIANRVWRHLIGQGIVRTADNFGRTGELPSHPELLDHLASELIESEWSIKHLVREIVLSRTFRMSSRHDEAGHALDPDNRLHWRAHRRRLEPEALRDAMLTAAGELDLTPMDSTVWYLGDQATAVGDNKVRRRTDFPCRSIYLPVIRNDLPTLFAVFDFADSQATTGTRSQTMVATQGLFMLNDDSVMAAAEAAARRLLANGKGTAPEDLVDRLFELALSAQTSGEERAELLNFVSDVRSRLTAKGDAESEVHAWAMACQALFASSRFQILE